MKHYYVYHTQSEEWVISRILEIKGKNEDFFDKNLRIKEILKILYESENDGEMDDLIERINRKNKLFGLSKNYNVVELLLINLISTLFIFLILILLKTNFIVSLIISYLYFILIEYLFFDYRLAKRARKLEKESLFYFQILSLNIESGNNLAKAIELTSNNINSDLSNEFVKVLDDVSLGKSLNEALDDLKYRIPSDTVNNIILNLIESNIYGSNIVESLSNQLSYLSDKILLDTKAKINKMPIKISLVSVFIFIPLILLIILSPLVINIANNN